ncbi:MAG: 50S ribosomal protein L30e [Candidatus Methanoperedens sp.]|nr:50S ribosomal protein L30e [Candidatus Methanoperedens sp.]MCZ7359874.1 50S ribosomal protein L30e [Candidatus Methanoperedens sp.]HLB69571.1 50S ribosomal protein L30e [Candidatus Methanoperedens sp.]
METDISKVLRATFSTGKVVVGTKQTSDAIKNGKAQVIVISSNYPEKALNEIKGVPVIRYPGSGADLGVACGKPFSIAALAVIEPGESDILSFGSMNE